MNLYEAIPLFGIMVALAAVPGASVVLVVTRSATLGVANGIAVSAGIVLGDLVFLGLAILGLAAAAEALGSLFVFLKFMAGLYLLWLGFSLLWKSGGTEVVPGNVNGEGGLLASFLAGVVLTLADVKAIVFYASILPLFMDMSALQAPDIAAIVLITVFSVGGVKVVYAALANRVAAWARRAKLETTTRRVAGSLMLGAGGCLIVKA